MNSQSSPTSESSDSSTSEEEAFPPDGGGTVSCGCGEEMAADGQTCHAPGISDGPVNYATGQMVHTETDLTSHAFGIPWGHTRTYANVLEGSGGNGSAINGNRWYVGQLKKLAFQFETGVTAYPQRVVVADSANASQYFIRAGSVYVNEHAGWNTLVWNTGPHEFVLTQARSGQQWVFYDHTAASAFRGLLKRVVDPVGQTVNCTYDSAGNLQKFEQVEGGQTSGFYYTWTSMFSIETVTLKLNDQNVRRARFRYYQTGDAGGSLDDLKSAIIEQFDAGTSSWRIVERKHYRYYTGSSSTGFASGLKLVIGAGAYQMMLDAGLDPETATETELMSFADFYYEYDGNKRVTRERLEGGRREYTFAYTHNSTSGSVNTWATKTVETLPDGSQNRVYSNSGNIMLVKILQKAGTSDQWVDYWTYTAQSRVLMHAHPSAVDHVTEPTPTDPVLTVHLKDAAGKIDLTDYYPTDDPGTGAVAGYVSARNVKQGGDGTPVILEKLKYDTQTVSGVSLHTVKERLVYPVAGMPDADAPKTLYARTYFTDGSNDTFQVKQLVTTLPAVLTAENGTGTAGVTKQIYDMNGRVTWEMDERGVITWRSYVQATGAPLQLIEDVDTSLMSGVPGGVPAGWSTVSGFGSHLVTDYLSDARGRVTQERGPWHSVQLLETDTATTAIRRVEFAAYDDVGREERRASGYLTGNEPTVAYTLVGAVRVTRMDGNGRVVDEIQAVRCSATGALRSDDPLPQGKWSRWTHRIYDPWGRLYAERVYHAIPAQGEGQDVVNYLETVFGYDFMGRQNRVVDPALTIQRTVFDVRNLAVSQWTGTNDTGATDADPTGGDAPGNNMVRVLQQEYDGGTAGGDGNLTKETLPVDDDSGNDRVTTYAYDFRDRRDTTTQTDGTTTWISKSVYDNLSRITGRTRYHTSVSNANRIAQDRMYFDARGRVFKTETDGIDPTSGNVVGTLTGQSWYDLAGNLIKQSQPGNTVFTKTVFDALNRPTVTYLCCRPGTAGVPSGDDNDVTNDTVIEQAATVYDAAGNVIQRTRKQRFDDATNTGALNGPQTQPKARNTYGMTWPDALGRPRTSADYGTNGGSAPTRPAVAPARSDVILVTTNRYRDSGDANAVIDPMGIETRWENDQAGRRIKLIEGIGTEGLPSTTACTVPPYPPPPAPRTTEFVWHANGQLSKLILVNAETGDQTTRWLFGTTLADSAVASNSLVRAKIYPESDDRPAPASDGPDGVYSRLEYRYNRQGQATAFKDADGTTHEYGYDKLGRQTEDRVTVLAAGLNGDVRRIGTSYDTRGLTWKITSHSAATGGSVVNEVAYEYDAFGNLVKDWQSHSGAVGGGTPKVQYAFTTGTGNRMRKVSVTYPNGRVVEYLYGDTNSMDDHLNRVSAQKVTGEGDNLVEYRYVGRNWQVRLAFPGPDIMCSYRKATGQPDGDAGDPYNGYDRFGRTVDMPWTTPIT